MKKKSIITVLLTLCLLTGCSNNSSEEKADNTQKADTTVSETTAVPETTTVTEAPKQTVTENLKTEHGAPEITDVSEREKEIFFNRDNMKIYGKLWLPEGEGPFPVVILSSGLYSPYTVTEEFAKKFADEGIAGVAFDFIGTGNGSKSDGEVNELTLFTEAADLNVVFESISSLPQIKSDNIFLWGHSLGGLTATYFAEQRPDDIKGLILVEPSYQSRDQCQKQLDSGATLPNDREGGIYIKDILAIDIYEKMSEYTGNVLLFQGTESDSIGAKSPEYFQRAANTFPSMQLETVQGANHFFTGDSANNMVERTIEYLHQNIG